MNIMGSVYSRVTELIGYPGHVTLGISLMIGNRRLVLSLGRKIKDELWLFQKLDIKNQITSGCRRLVTSAVSPVLFGLCSAAPSDFHFYILCYQWSGYPRHLLIFLFFVNLTAGLTCLFSLLCAMLLAFLDARAEKILYKEEGKTGERQILFLIQLWVFVCLLHQFGSFFQGVWGCIFSNSHTGMCWFGLFQVKWLSWPTWKTSRFHFGSSLSFAWATLWLFCLLLDLGSKCTHTHTHEVGFGWYSAPDAVCYFI